LAAGAKNQWLQKDSRSICPINRELGSARNSRHFDVLVVSNAATAIAEVAEANETFVFYENESIYLPLLPIYRFVNAGKASFNLFVAHSCIFMGK